MWKTLDGSGYSFNIGTDGNMSVRDASDVLQWTSNTAGVAPLSFCIDDCGLATLSGADGRRDASDVLQWTSNTAGVAPLSFCIDDCGLATLSGADGRTVWQSDYTTNTGLDDYPSCATTFESNCVDVT
eukprot:836992_1